MKRIAIAMLAVVVVVGAQTKDEAQRLLKAAKNTEFVDGDLNGAIKQYRAIVSKYAKTDRGVAAAALMDMAECHQKMGDAEARKIYEQVVKEYGDQKEAVALARTKLGSAPKPITLKQAWSGPKVDVYGSISPDGRYLSFVDWKNHGNLALHDLTTGADRTIAPGGEAEYSTISRDGKTVAYAWYKPNLGRYEVRLANLNGDPKPRTLYDNEDVEETAPYDWSPDGNWIAVSVRRKDHTAQLGLLSSRDGSLRVLKSINWRGATRMFFSPDGRFVAYDLLVGDAADQRDVFVLAVDGSRETAAAASPSEDVVMGWSPDGRYLLFASTRTGSMGLWALAMRDGKPQGQPELLKAGIGTFESSMGVTASGALYFGRIGGIRDVEIVPVDWAEDKLLGPPANAIQKFVGSNSHPSWSADGKLLSCVSLRDPTGANKILVIVSVDAGKVVREVRPRMGFISDAQISPDGNAFLVAGTDLRGRRGIFHVEVPTGETTPLVMPEEPADAGPAEQAVNPRWAPDGKSFFFIRTSRDHGAPTAAIIEKELASRAEKQIIQDPHFGGMRMSPDGRWIATGTTDPTTHSTAILLVPAHGGEPRELLRATGPAQLRFPGWAPGSRALIVQKSLTGDWAKSREIWMIPIDGGEPRRMEVNLASLPNVSALQFSPDGRYIAYETSSGSLAEVSVLENFIPAPGNAK